MKFRELPPVGSDATEREGNLLELMQSIPYLLTGNRLPPLQVLNSIFETRSVDAGISGGVEWKPFTISSQDHDELAAQCRQLNIDTPDYPKWVRDRSDFQVWEMEIERGVPAKEHKVLADLADRASVELKRAIESGASESDIAELHLKVIETGQELVEFLDDKTHT